MKTINKFLLFIVFIVVVATSCRKSFQELSVNENKPSSVQPSLLMTGVLNSLSDLPDGQSEILDQYYLYNYDYYGNNRYDLGSGTSYYGVLENVVRMEEEAMRAGGNTVNPYRSLGLFFRAYFYTKMSLEMGDVPLDQSLQGLENLTPAYSLQKDIFKQSLLWLDTANSNLTQLINNPDLINTTEGQILKGDIYYSNDLKQWQKAVNTFKIRLLIQLSRKENDLDLNIKQQFAAIINNKTQYPVFESEADNLSYTFINPTNFYPNNPNSFGFDGSRRNTSKTYLGLLTQLQDPRTFITAEPSRYQVDSLGKSDTSFSAFVGADPGLDLGVMYAEAGAGRYSFLNRKYFFSTYTGEKSIQIGYAELQFNIAEAINRGWISGDAESYYSKGIQSSIQSYGVPLEGSFTAYFYRPGSTDVTNSANYNTYTIPFSWAAYYAQPSVKYAGGATGLTQILQQEYLALFRHSGLLSYFNYRRTGVPTFTTGPGTGNGNRIALRFQYPGSERSANTDNYNSALQSQYGGNDDINGVMWILK